MKRSNLLADLPPPTGAEHFETLVQLDTGRVERIVSHGHSSPADFWYDQESSEWVLILQGRATLEFEGRGDGDRERLELGPGDAVDIPPHTRHRVAWTIPDQPTVWLAVHY